MLVLSCFCLKTIFDNCIDRRGTDGILVFNKQNSGSRTKTKLYTQLGFVPEKVSKHFCCNNCAKQFFAGFIINYGREKILISIIGKFCSQIKE